MNFCDGCGDNTQLYMYNNMLYCAKCLMKKLGVEKTKCSSEHICKNCGEESWPNDKVYIQTDTQLTFGSFDCMLRYFGIKTF